MKTKPHHVGTIVLALDRDPIDPRASLFMGLKPPKNKSDTTRTRARVARGCWTPLGGGNEPADRTPKHAAQRELFQESGRVWRRPLGDLRKVALLESFVVQGASSTLADDMVQFVWRVHVYMTVIPENKVDAYQPCSEYERVSWHPIAKLPWEKMMYSDQLWLPRIFHGEEFATKLLYEGEIGGRLADYSVIPKRF